MKTLSKVLFLICFNLLSCRVITHDMSNFGPPTNAIVIDKIDLVLNDGRPFKGIIPGMHLPIDVRVQDKDGYLYRNSNGSLGSRRFTLESDDFYILSSELLETYVLTYSPVICA